MKEFEFDQADESGIGTKEVINNVKTGLKMLLDNFEANKEPNKDEISKNLKIMMKKTEGLVKSIYDLTDLDWVMGIVYDLT